MIRFKRKLSPRESVLFSLTTLGLLCLLVVHGYLLPAYDQWQLSKSSAQLQGLEYAKLNSNLAIKQSVNQQFHKLGPNALQLKSDQITLSEYLRELETLTRHPSITLINMKPLPVKAETNHKIFHIKLSVAGKLPEILQFVTELTHGETITGLEGFSLRAMQGNNMVECSLSLWMVRLMPESIGSELPNSTQNKEMVLYGG